MRSFAGEDTPLTLIIQRLMDADLLLFEEGSALLAEVETFDQARDNAPGNRASERRVPLLLMLEALQQTGDQEASVAGQARAIIHQILHGQSDPA